MQMSHSDQWREKTWPSNLPRQLRFSAGAKPLAEYLTDHAEACPNRAAIVFYNQTITYKELDTGANAFANFLIASGFKKKDRIALFLTTFPGFAIAYLGILKMGGIVVACSPDFKAWELEYQLSDSGSRAVVCLDDHLDIVKEVSKNHRIESIIVTGYRDFLNAEIGPDIPPEYTRERKHAQSPDAFELTDILAQYTGDAPECDIRLDDIALLQYTGGTTGLPKGAIHTHYNAIYKTACRASIAFNGFDTQQEPFYMLQMAKIYHIAGMLQFNVNLYQGVSQVLFPKFDTAETLKAIHTYRPAILSTVTPMNAAMMNHPDIEKYDLKSVRRSMIVSLGMPLTKELARRWGRFIAEDAQIAESSYGLTETHTGDTFMPLDREPKWGKPGEMAVGVPVYGGSIKIVSLENNNEIVPVGEKGEIAVYSPSNFKGYWNKPAETQNTLIDGWVYTGDIGKFDADGYLYWLGRAKEMIKVSGYSVFPEEVELLLKGHPHIAECGVTGIADPKKGEVVKAVVVPRAQYGDLVSANEIREWAAKKMAYYKVPQEIEIRDSLPVSGTGKLLRRKL